MWNSSLICENMSETLNMKGLCRCCLSEGEFSSLDAPYKCYGNDSPSALLRETFNITMSPAPGPDNASTYTICGRCTSQLQDAAQFRNQVLECEKKFAAHVQNYLRGDNYYSFSADKIKIEVETLPDNSYSFSADKIKIEVETLQDEQIEHTSIPIVKKEIENDNATNEQIEHTSSIPIVKKEIENDNAISPEQGNDDDHDNKCDYKIDVSFVDFQHDKEMEERMKPETKIINPLNHNGERTRLASLICIFCEEIFCGKMRLRSHVQATHIPQDSRHFSCPSCNITFNERIDLIKHLMLKHERVEYHCAFCIDTFPTFNGLRTHELTHTKKSGYLCDYCQKSYVHKKSLKLHIDMHMGKAGNKCELCGVVTRYASELKVHIRSVHAKIRPFKCDLCPKTYKLKKNLTNHRRVHTGGLPYECDVCFKRFRSKYLIMTHQKRRRHLPKSAGPAN